MLRHVRAVTLIVLVFHSPLWAGLGSDKTMYIGGTVSNLKEKTEGKSSATSDTEFVFQYKDGKKQSALTIPYKQINGLEYGQKAGRRVGAAVVVSPFFLFSKKRRHYLTVSFTDADSKQQAAVFELGKGVIKETLAALEAKSGHKVEYQDEEARKSATSQ